MKKIYILLVILINFSGCIRQELIITLNKDGSGHYQLKRSLNEVEGMMMHLAEYLSDEDIVEIEKQSNQNLTITKQVLNSNQSEGSEKIEIIDIRFKQLTGAIVELENLIPLGPRYQITEEHINIYLDREKQDFDGTSSSSDIEKSPYYHLTLNLPTTPQSSTGIIKGNKIQWKFDKEDFQEYIKSPIGTTLFKVSIPKDSMTLELKPKLFTKKDRHNKRLSNSKKEEPQYGLKEFKMRVPIISKNTSNTYDSNTELKVNFDISKYSYPLPYENLTVTEFIVAGQRKAIQLASPQSGVLTGRDHWGRKENGFPVKLSFNHHDPWLKQIDIIKVNADVILPTKLKTHTLSIQNTKELPPLIKYDNNPSLFFIQKIELGSSRASYPAPEIKLLTNLESQDIMNIFLDTSFGLRYQPLSQSSKTKSIENYWGEEKKKLNSLFEQSPSLNEINLNFNNIPKNNFKIVIEQVIENSHKKITLVQENIDVRNNKK